VTLLLHFFYSDNEISWKSGQHLTKLRRIRKYCANFWATM